MPAPPVLNFPPVLNVFPGRSVLPGLDIKVVWRPRAQNFDPQTAASGREVIVSAAIYPMHEFDLIYSVLGNRTLTEVEFKTLMGFWLGSLGREFPFKFSNPYDNAVTAQSLGQTINGQSQYLLTRTYGAGGYSGTEPIGILDYSATFNLYINGVLTPSSDPTYGYQVNLLTPWNQLLQFNSVPPAAQALTVDMTYFYYCRFGDDTTEFEQILYNIWQNTKITLVSKKGG